MVGLFYALLLTLIASPAAGFHAALRMPSHRLRMQLDEYDFEAEAAKIAAIVAEKRPATDALPAPENPAPDFELDAVSVDLALSLNDGDVAHIIAEADEVFERIDLDGDGRVSPDELSAHLEGLHLSVEAVERMFRYLDTDTDGVVSRDELRGCFQRYESANVRLALGLAPGCGSPDLRQAADRQGLADELFDTIDTNGDGAISIAEMRAHLTGTGYSHVDIDGIFRALDLDGDGDISRSELQQGFARYEYPVLRLALNAR